MIEMTLQGVQCRAAEATGPDGKRWRVLRFEDPQSGIALVVPLDPAAALSLSNALAGRAVTVPGRLPDGWKPPQ